MTINNKAASYRPTGISTYVPSMSMAADVDADGTHLVSLGAPSAIDTDGVFDGVTADATVGGNTYTSSDRKATYSAGMGSTYGRTLTFVASAGADHVVTVTGKDYLGQAVKETITLSGTTILYGLKAFYDVDSMLVAAGAAGDTLDVGWSDVLGLPYAAEGLVAWAEDNVDKGVNRNAVATSQAMVYATDASLFIAAPVAGFVKGLSSVSTIANTSTANVLTAEIGGTAIAGLTVSVATDDAIGDSYTDFAGTNDNGLTSKVAKGGGLEIVSDVAGTSGAGVVQLHIEENVSFIDADTTATMTATTGDTRGTVQPYTSCDGSVVFECKYRVKMTNMHGIAQYSG